MTNEEAIKLLKQIEIREALQEDYDAVYMAIDALKKKIPKRVYGKNREFTIEDYKGIRDTRYKCPECKKPTRIGSTYCYRCGQKLLFPVVKYSKHVEGEVQDKWLDWSDT